MPPRRPQPGRAAGSPRASGGARLRRARSPGGGSGALLRSSRRASPTPRGFASGTATPPRSRADETARRSPGAGGAGGRDRGRPRQGLPPPRPPEPCRRRPASHRLSPAPPGPRHVPPPPPAAGAAPRSPPPLSVREAGGRAARPGRRSERRRRGRGESRSMEHNHLHLHNGSLVPHHRYGCGLGYAPVVYYSLLLCLGLPGECRAEPRGWAAGKRLPPGCCSAPERRSALAAPSRPAAGTQPVTKFLPSFVRPLEVKRSRKREDAVPARCPPCRQRWERDPGAALGDSRPSSDGRSGGDRGDRV